MERYKNSGGDSNVLAYEIGLDYIRVQFSGTSRIYTYSFKKAGSSHVEQMKGLAEKGSGLNSYINKYTKHLND